MSIREDNELNKEYLLKGFPVCHLNESKNLTYILRLNKYYKPLIKCHVYSELKNRNNPSFIYTIAEFNQGVELEDICNNPFLISDLLELGIRYIAFFSGDIQYIINGIACSDYIVLDEAIHQSKYRITDVPISNTIKIYDLQDYIQVDQI